MGIDAEMYLKTRREVTQAEIKAVSWELGQHFGPEHFWIGPPNVEAGLPGHYAVEVVESYDQDGPTIYPEPGETFVRVNLWTRYYGPDYERGNAVLILAVAKYLEGRLAPCSVHYGGDSSGVCAEPFDAEARERLWQHFAKHGHWPYQSYFGKHAPPPPVCDFCDHEMVNYGGGPDASYYYCQGCGRNTHISASGQIARDDWKKDEP